MWAPGISRPQASHIPQQPEGPLSRNQRHHRCPTYLWNKTPAAVCAAVCSGPVCSGRPRLVPLCVLCPFPSAVLGAVGAPVPIRPVRRPLSCPPFLVLSAAPCPVRRAPVLSAAPCPVSAGPCPMMILHCAGVPPRPRGC